MIRSAVDYVKTLQAAAPGRPWLVVGKGPTAGLAVGLPPGMFHVLTLNHACRLVRPALAHFVDWEAFGECAEALANAEVPVCLPWVPHVNNRPGDKALSQLHCLFGTRGRSVPLAWLVAKDKAFAYNASNNARKWDNPRLPVVRLRYFSAVGAFNLLAKAGVKEIRSCGVDGGTGYHPSFDAKDRLANGRASFDAQESELRAAVAKHGITWTRLESPWDCGSG